MEGKKIYRLGLDLGVGSIGYCLLVLNADNTIYKILALGSRLFDVGSAVGNLERRQKRSQRRTNRRKKTRLIKLWSFLAEHNMSLPIPKDIDKRPELDRFPKKTLKKCPYELRAKAVEGEQLPLFHLGYAFYHLANHRGSSAVRFSDSDEGKKESESLMKSKKIQDKIDAGEYKTYGHFLYESNLKDKSISGENRKKIVRNRANKGFEYFPNRDLILDEIRKIIEVQQKFYPEIFDKEFEDEKTFEDKIIEFCDFESDMLEPEAGDCAYVEGEKRLPKAHPLTEERRLYEVLNNVRFYIKPLYLRKMALDEKVPFECLGTLFYHLVFGSEVTEIQTEIQKTKLAMDQANARTYAEFILEKYQGSKPGKRKNKNNQENTLFSTPSTETNYDTSEDLILNELDCIFDVQKEHHSQLNDAFKSKLVIVCKSRNKNELKELIKDFYKDILSKNQSKGEAIYLPFLYKKDRLVSTEKEKLINEFFKKNRTDLTAQKFIDTLGFKDSFCSKDDIVLQGQDKKEQKIKGSFLSQLLNLSFWEKMGEEKKERFFQVWNATHDRYLKKKLREEFKFSNEQMEEIFPKNLGETLKLPSDYAPIGKTATEILLPWIKEGKSFIEAVEQAIHDGEIKDDLINLCDSLPYYGKVLRGSTQDVISKAFNKKFIKNHHNVVEPKTNEDEKMYGRIANPVVHKALNQVRNLVNEIIGQFRKPDYIVLEMARELKKSKAEREKISSNQNTNEENRKKIISKLQKAGISPHSDNLEKQILMYSLMEEQGGKCFYSGKTITVEHIKGVKVDIDHILPFSRTRDNSRANKVLAFEEENKNKSNKSPAEFFNPQRMSIIQKMIDENKNYEWEKKALKEKLENKIYNSFLLRQSKTWRIREDAMEIWEQIKPDFLDRFKTDTSYIAKVSKKYLNCLYDKSKKEEIRVDSCKGGATAHLRKIWGLEGLLKKFANEAIDSSLKVGHIKADKAEELREKQSNDKKVRMDNRHHALDAFVIALTEPSYNQEIAKSNKKKSDLEQKLILERIKDKDERNKRLKEIRRESQRELTQKITNFPVHFSKEEIESKKESAINNLSKNGFKREKIKEEQIEREAKKILFSNWFYQHLKEAKVSRKTDHRYNGSLEEESLYSIYNQNKDGSYYKRIRKDLVDLLEKKESTLDEIKNKIKEKLVGELKRIRNKEEKIKDRKEKNNTEKEKIEIEKKEIHTEKEKTKIEKKEIKIKKEEIKIKEDFSELEQEIRFIKLDLEENEKIYKYIEEIENDGTAKKSLEVHNNRIIKENEEIDKFNKELEVKNKEIDKLNKITKKESEGLNQKKYKLIEKEGKKRALDLIKITPINILEEAIRLSSKRYNKYFHFSKTSMKIKLSFRREPEVTTDKNGNEKLIRGFGYNKGSNFCLDLYHNKEGKLCGEVIRRIDIVKNLKKNQDDKFVPNYKKQGFELFERVFGGDVLEVDSSLFGDLESGTKKGRIYVKVATYTESPSYEKNQQNILIDFKPFHVNYPMNRSNGVGRTLSDKSIQMNNPKKIILNELGQEKYIGPVWKDKE